MESLKLIKQKKDFLKRMLAKELDAPLSNSWVKNVLDALISIEIAILKDVENGNFQQGRCVISAQDYLNSVEKPTPTID